MKTRVSLKYFVSYVAFSCLKLRIKTPEQGVKYYVFIVDFEHISHLVLMFLLLTLNR